MIPRKLSRKALAALRDVAEGRKVPPSAFSTLSKHSLVKATGSSPKRVTLTAQGADVLATYRDG